MNKILNVYKPVGMTPLALIEKIRKQMPELKIEKIGYAGRLDPMAHGVMLLMVGDATKERDNYLGLEKEYEFEVLFGVETDTYDIMGMILYFKKEFIIVNENVNIFVKQHIGKLIQSYPPYSSKAINGKPLFWWARNNKLHEITIPQKEVTIDAFEKLTSREVSKQELESTIEKNISAITGDFRQKEILVAWNKFFSETKQTSYQTIRFRIVCSSGTYVRGLVSELGKTLGCGAITTEILRTRVGVHVLKDSLRVTGE